MRDVYVAGAAVHPFGKHRELTAADLGFRAVSSLVQQTGITPDRVDAGFGGSTYGGSLLAQRVLQRVDLNLDRRLREEIATLILEQTGALVPLLRARLETVVREVVAEAVAEEMESRQRSGVSGV